jgi:integrase/recombinase XerD
LTFEGNEGSFSTVAKPVRFTPKNTESGWRINIPAKFSESGKRERHFFRTQALALAAGAAMKAKVETFGIQARAIAPTLAERAIAADVLLRPYGIDILEAARIAISIRERDNASNTLAKAAKAWLVSCEGLRPRTIYNYKLTTDRMEKSLGKRLLSTITADEIKESVAPAGTPAPAAHERLRNAKAFWNYSAGKGWCVAEVFKKVEMPRTKSDADEIQILTPEAAECLLRVAEKYFPKAVATYAIQFFAGVRVAETGRLEEEHADFEGINLPKGVTKKGSRRHITPNITLATWLERYPFEPCPNWRETNAACRRLAGWDVSARIINDRTKAGTMEPLPVPTRGRWPQNAIRHSHASYAVASGVPLESLLFEFGHTGDATLLRRHYVGRASKKQALEYFAIAPEGMEIPQRLEVVA